MLRNESAVAQKVYEAVPMQQTWTTGEICKELGRMKIGIGNISVPGCLKTLKRAGLVKEPKHGHFVRAKVRAATEAETAEEIEMPEPTTTPASPADAVLESMSKIRKDLDRVQADFVELENAVLAMTSGNDAELNKLRALKQALSILNT